MRPGRPGDIWLLPRPGSRARTRKQCEHLTSPRRSATVCIQHPAKLRGASVTSDQEDRAAMTAAEPTSDEALPLRDVRVIEMGHLIAGPFCGSLLADLGAEVIKIENPDGGDPMRRWGTSQSEPDSLWWPIIGRNKKSVTVDLHLESGRQHGPPAHRDRRRRDRELPARHARALGHVVRATGQDNPGVILVRVSGFGQTGPYARRAGYGAIAEAVGGIRYITGDPGSPPSRIRDQPGRLGHGHVRLHRGAGRAARAAEDRPEARSSTSRCTNRCCR